MSILISSSDGTRRWVLDDMLHRVDGPAVEYPDGTKEWFLYGKLHRVDGPAFEHSSGTKWWYVNDKLHRINGPAIEWESGTKMWYINGKRHRVDGPAVEHSNGTKKWYLNDELFTSSDYYALLKLRKIRLKVSIFNYALKFNLSRLLKSSRNKAVVEWYYSPDNGGGRLAKKRLEQFIDSTNLNKNVQFRG